MPIAQPGIFAQGTRSHSHLEFDLRPGAEPADLLEVLGDVRQPAVTVGGANIVVGFGPDLWRRLSPNDAPPQLGPFPDIEGVPVTQHDIWTWFHGTGSDVMLDVARAVSFTLAGVATLASEVAGFIYHDSRDLSGFIDGTANPGPEEAAEVALVADGPGAGGSFVLAQRWVHDLGRLHALPVHEQEGVIGRTKPDSTELEGPAKPDTAHISRVEISEGGEELSIYRRSVPYGSVQENGLYFLAFSADPSRFDKMLRRMFGQSGDGVRDRLTEFTTPVAGALYFAPSIEALRGVLG
jgi:putative iron-dependent peroxidase